MDKTEIINKYNPKIKENYLLSINCEDDENFIQKDIDSKFTQEKIWITLRHYTSSKDEQVNFVLIRLFFK